ncbi:hypothetical protein, partial [Pseudomonas benzopyrenica]|uniref:hypothetical protein n=1 Tax=Pseudomonas benzopyrenica TaxID=2993566 RepID=UPI002282CA77
LLGHQTPLYGEHSRPKWVSGISRPLQPMEKLASKMLGFAALNPTYAGAALPPLLLGEGRGERSSRLPTDGKARLKMLGFAALNQPTLEPLCPFSLWERAGVRETPAYQPMERLA